MMDYLARESAPISSELWEKIDAVVIDAARKHMVCRRFLSLHGPLGAGTSVVAVDGADKEESLRNGHRPDSRPPSGGTAATVPGFHPAVA